MLLLRAFRPRISEKFARREVLKVLVHIRLHANRARLQLVVDVEDFVAVIEFA